MISTATHNQSPSRQGSLSAPRSRFLVDLDGIKPISRNVTSKLKNKSLLSLFVCVCTIHRGKGVVCQRWFVRWCREAVYFGGLWLKAWWREDGGGGRWFRRWGDDRGIVVVLPCGQRWLWLWSARGEEMRWKRMKRKSKKTNLAYFSFEKLHSV